MIRQRCPGCSRATTVDDLPGEIVAPPAAPAVHAPLSRPAWRYLAGGGVLLGLSLAGWLSPTPATVSPFTILSVAQASTNEVDERNEIVDDNPVRSVPREAPPLLGMVPTVEGITRATAASTRERPFPAAPSFFPAGEVVHPVAVGDRIVPSGATGRFGAERHGDRPSECGSGHCGIDLRAEEGTVILAVRAGTVITARSDENGSGGRFIKLTHADGTSTYYFHLEQIRPGLTAGMEVTAGEPIATLGRTGVTQSPTHLHFAMTVRDADGHELYVDPLPMIETAEIAPAIP
jgi:murein DD-endopeptidase MepM/ murein hydrolase activator NlpD